MQSFGLHLRICSLVTAVSECQSIILDTALAVCLLCMWGINNHDFLVPHHNREFDTLNCGFGDEIKLLVASFY